MNTTNTEGVNTVYEWDEDKLIRETNTDVATNKTYDIWYLYDDKGNMIGYEYIYLDANNTIKSSRVYYEKDIQGNIVGLLDEKGYWIATYSYDAWGNLIKITSHQTKGYLASVNHIGYKGYYRDDESGFYYLGKGYYVPEICRMLNPDETKNILEKEKNIGKSQLSHNNYLYSNGNPISLPTDGTGYDTDYGVNQQVEVCETSSLLFESLSVFNTNCYGFVINCWTYAGKDGIYPGMCENSYSNIYNNKHVSCIKVTDYVNQDFNYWGKEVQLLTGNDNNPYYETDNEHFLIAVRTMSEESFKACVPGSRRERDYFHFMVKKNDGWYFKAGWDGPILKLTKNYNPSTVNWSMYECNEKTGKLQIKVGCDKLYDSDIQYMVIPKIPLQIK